MKRSILLVVAFLIFALCMPIANAKDRGDERLEPIADAWTDAQYPNTNYGTSSGAMCRNNYAGTPYNDRRRSWFKFELEGYKDFKKVKAARFYVYLYDFYAWRIDTNTTFSKGVDSWNENTITWNNQPAYDSYFAVTLTNTSRRWYSVDVLDLMKSEVDGILTIVLNAGYPDGIRSSSYYFLSRHQTGAFVQYLPYIGVDFKTAGGVWDKEPATFAPVASVAALIAAPILVMALRRWHSSGVLTRTTPKTIRRTWTGLRWKKDE